MKYFGELHNSFLNHLKFNAKFKLKMLTVDDIKRLTEVFATKQELKDLEGRLLDKLATRQQYNQVMNGVDRVLKELVEMREEKVVQGQQIKDLDDRVTKIESVPATAHQIKRK